MRVDSFALVLATAFLLAGCTLDKVREIEQKTQSEAAALERDKAANAYREAADKLRDMGSAKAADYYKKAIDAAPDIPFYRYAYADYLRKYRGPGQPLFPAAANEHFVALELLDVKEEDQEHPTTGDQDLRQDIGWGLTDLYQRDGMPVLSWSAADPSSRRGIRRLTAFFSTQYESGPAEIPIRDLTSGAFWTGDTMGRTLTRAELRSMIRSKRMSDWTNRVRIRPGDLPWIDIWWRRVEAGDAIPNQWSPGDSFDQREVQRGIAIEQTFDCYPWFDMSVRAGYKESKRRIVKGAAADDLETSCTPFAETVLSRVFPGYLGPNKLSLTLKHERSHIHTNYFRRGSIGSATVRYSIFPKKGQDRFTPRSMDVEAGVVRYLQEYDDVDVHQYDLFAGVNLREIIYPEFDLAARYTVFDEAKTNSAPERRHRQGRVSLTPLWRLVDNENAKEKSARNSPVRFVNIIMPMDFQFTQKGPSDYENYGYGLRAETRIAHPGFLRRTSLLLFAECSRRHYHNLDKVLSFWTIGLKMGF